MWGPDPWHVRMVCLFPSSGINGSLCGSANCYTTRSDLRTHLVATRVACLYVVRYLEVVRWSWREILTLNGPVVCLSPWYQHAKICKRYLAVHAGERKLAAGKSRDDRKESAEETGAPAHETALTKTRR